MAFGGNDDARDADPARGAGADDTAPTWAAETEHAPASGLAPGTIFAGHRIEAVAGRGGMGIVYRARNLVLDRVRALKVIAEDISNDSAFRERFRRESQLAAAIEHPNLIPVHDAGEERGRLYLAMRFVDGTDLGELIGTGRPLEPAHLIPILDQVAAALDAAHAGGLVHRDVKPANLLLEGEPGAERAYLSDFGISKLVSAAGELTTTGRFMGTVDYVAPEQISGDPVDRRADVYSLSCVAFHALAGRPPFRRETQLATLFAHANAPRPPLSEVRPSSAPELDDVLARGMAQDPEDRFASAGELAGAAREALGLPPAALGPPPAPARRVTRRSRRRPAAIVAGCVVLAAAAVAALLLAGDGAEEDPQGQASGQDASSPRPVVTVKVGESPKGLTVGEGQVWIASMGERAVDVIDATSGDKRSIPLDAKPISVAVGFGSLWVVDQQDAVLRVAPDGADPPVRIDVGEKPVDVALDERWVWVASEGDDQLYRIDPESNGVDANVKVGDEPRSVATGLGSAWVANIDDRSVSRVDAQTVEQVGPPVEVGPRPNDLAVGEGYVWVTDVFSGTLSRIDPGSQRVVGDPLEVGSNPRGVKTGFGYVWVANGGDGELARVDPASARLAGDPVKAGPDAADVAIGADSVWTSNVGNSTVTRIRP